MCGIFGIAFEDLNQRPDLEGLKAMGKVLRHRGPDKENFWTAPGIGFGHERLSIIDLATGDQPMSSSDGKATLVFNGEIYNFQEIRKGLEAGGVRFKTNSDTEAILHLYRKKGADCVNDLRGMFAFAIWDHEKKELFLARDRAGKKPLFYTEWQKQFIFASEIKSLLQLPGIPREINFPAVNSYFAYTYVPYPQTAFHRIYELPPAHTLLWKQGKMKVERYWKPDFSQKLTLSEDQACQELWEIAKESTRLRLTSDVPLGAFLSGGIDSSTVVALMREVSGGKIKTFSIGFEDADFNELPHAQKIANLFETDHEEFIVRPDAKGIIPKMVWHYDQPFSDSSALPTFYVAQMARKRVSVVLNGDGGDENFCGYPRFRGLRLWQMIDQIPGGIRQLLASLHPLVGRPNHPSHLLSRLHRFLKYLPDSTLERYKKLMIQFPAEFRNQIFTPEIQVRFGNQRPEQFLESLYQNAGGKDSMDRFLEMELLSFLPGDLLTKMDRATMAYGLEARSPFLDHHIIEFAAKLPFSYKMRGFQLKWLMKQMMKQRLPQDILSRPKWGFGAPISRWFRKELKDYVRNVLLDPVAGNRPYFRPGVVKRLLEEHQSGRYEHGFRIWTLLMFELWHRKFIDQVPERE